MAIVQFFLSAWEIVDCKSSNCKFLHCHNLFVLNLEHAINLLDVLVVCLLNLVLIVLLHVFGSAGLDGLLQFLDGIATSVAHTHFGGLCLFRTLLRQVLTAFLGQGWDTETDELTDESMMAFSMTLSIDFSQGLMVMLRASGVLSDATLLSGTMLP